MFNFSLERKGIVVFLWVLFLPYNHLPIVLSRLCCLSATKWPRITYFNRTNTTMFPMIPGTK